MVERKLTRELLDQKPPAAESAERGVLGSFILVPDYLDDLAGQLRAEDFYDQRNATIYELAIGVHNSGRRVDVELLLHAAKKAGALESIGGAAYLAEIASAVPIASNAVHYAELVRDAAIRRELRQVGSEVIRSASDDGLDAMECLTAVEQKVLAIRDRRGAANCRTSSVAAVLQEAMAAIDRRRESKMPVGLSSGFDDIDSICGGLRPAELIILAARPSMGKTALALNVAAHLATSRQVLFFSAEMSSISLGDRLLASWAQVDGTKLSSGNLTTDERQRIVGAAAALSQSGLVLDDSVSPSMQEIAAITRRQKRRKGLALVVIDYLGLLRPENARDPREQQVATISKRLKALARELEVPVVCLSQLNRQLESTADKVPTLAHLRESGAIEQDADQVWFVHRPERFATKPEEVRQLKGKAQVIIAKNRNGRTGRVNLCWHESIVTFRPAEQHEAGNW